MRKLAMLDASFLYLESSSMPMNIGSVQKFALATTSSSFYEDVRDLLAQRAPLIPFMSCKLKPTPLALDHPVWIFDQAFDIDQHLVRIKLSGKGTQRQLERRIAQCHEEHLPRDRPLWKYYLFEGLDDGSVVLFEKYHHACFDGVAGQQIMDLLFTEQPGDDLPEIESTMEEEPESASLLLDAARQLVQQSVNSLRTAPAGLRAFGRLARQFAANTDLLTRSAPRTPFNATISPYRGWTCVSLKLPEVRRIARANACSVNDVFLAICAGGLWRYLRRRNELPETPLLCGVPVSLRKRPDGVMNNRVGMIVTSLATHKRNPLNRLVAIRESMRMGKALLADTSELTPDDFHLPGIGGMFSLAAVVTGIAGWADTAPPPINLVISNVPGPSTTRYLCGQELLTHYPLSIPGDSMALNITCQSYVDRLDIGFTACLETVPDLARLRRDTVAAWDELKQLTSASASNDEIVVSESNEESVARDTREQVA